MALFADHDRNLAPMDPALVVRWRSWRPGDSSSSRLTSMKISDLPFHEGDPAQVLRLDQNDPDFSDVGWCRLPEVWLDSRQGEPSLLVHDALVLALHSPEEPEPLSDDVELEFWDQGVSVLLSKFLALRLPALRDAADRAIVLALCNPLDATLPAPAAAGGVPVWFGLGDVESWLEEDHAGRRIRLSADVWRTAV
jgi:hypothetical protein